MENKTSKYFKYAIGEIILVVIGILIALQINNWNNNRIDSKREANYIKNIERDLNNQLLAIETQMDFEKEIVQHCGIALQSYNEKSTLKMDSTMAVALGTITGRRTFLNPNPTYKELISSGNIELIKNEDFKTKLINYYEELERIEKIMANNNSLFTDQEFIPSMMRLGVMDHAADWSNITRGFSRSYKSENPLTAKNVKRLSTISDKLLKQEENELLFINHLTERKGYAFVHVFFLLEFKVQTEKLLEAIKEY